MPEQSGQRGDKGGGGGGVEKRGGGGGDFEKRGKGYPSKPTPQRLPKLPKTAPAKPKKNT
jgi:hypothetical protein